MRLLHSFRHFDHREYAPLFTYENLILPGSELGLESEPLWEGKFCGLGLECL